ncbi:STAS domain-containing protein [Alkalimarinus alittae]|uniref:STAS domain-containing protein n=1 Tax=Alkalimarinus alittae TaxID=2961619 RepID=A0ABY6MZL2_9ALTE|nr:STAS domain-containing protein [Alkalimarinus alittae]UZE95197.1 STAS domain-containing protein [Alkalimarinus alittae]
MVAEVNALNTDTLMLVGDVTADNVVSIRSNGEAIISRMASKGIIDLARLSSANTITLSLLLSWLRFAKHNNVSLTIAHLPSQLFDMARVSGLELILPFESA